MNLSINKVCINNIEMSYCCFGEGEKAFVILPGLSIRPVTESASIIYDAFTLFKKNYTVYLFDRRTNIPKEYSINQMADDTYQVMKYLNINKADFFGASQGGMILLCLAVNHPEIINKMVLGSTACRNNETLNNVVNQWIVFSTNHEGYLLNKSVCEAIYSKSTIHSYGDVLFNQGSVITESDMDRFTILASSIKDFDVSEEIKSIKCPTLVIGCHGDNVTTFEGSQEIADILKCESYSYNNEYGHAVFDEAADYRNRLLEFLSH